MSGFESPHATLSDPRWLRRELRAIVCVLASVVGRIRDDVAMSDSVGIHQQPHRPDRLRAKDSAVYPGS